MEDIIIPKVDNIKDEVGKAKDQSVFVIDK